METPNWLPYALLATGIGAGLKLGGDALAKRPNHSISTTTVRDRITPEMFREDLKARHEERLQLLPLLYAGKELQDQIKAEYEAYLTSLR